MEEKIILSIIIPVFNVEQYLKKCLNSIIKTSDNKNIELILVDDGSTDSSSKICDDYSSKYKFIKTLHTENLGVAHARNIGLEVARGKWISWIDGDDIVSPDYVETLKKLIKLNLADVYKFNYGVGKDNIKLRNASRFNKSKLEVETKDKIMAELPAPKFGNYLWCRLFRRSIFKNLRFPEGNNCEDAYLMVEVLSRCKTFYYYDEILYYHIYHDNTITTSSNRQIRNKQLNDWFKSNVRLTTRLKELNYQNAYEYAQSQLVYISFVIMNRIRKDKLSNKKLYDEISGVLDNYKKYDSKRMSGKLKILLFMRLHCQPLYNIIMMISNKEKRV